MAIPNGWGNLGFTSGRRTYRGNKLVGGVGNSGHLTGSAADFTAPLDVLRAQFPGKPILNEGDHRHVSGLSDVPYHGNQGIAGLVNGVDTSAPQGRSAMIQPRKPRTLGQATQPYYPEQPLNDPAMSFGGMAPQAPPQQFADAPQLAAPKPGAFGKGGVGWKILGSIGDAMAAYGGQRGVYGPAMAQQMESDREDNRFQEQLAARIQEKREAAMAKAAEPPQFIQNMQAYQGMPEADKRAYLNYLDNTQPIAVSGPQGTERVPRSLGGPPQEAVSELRAAIQQGDQSAIDEFEQVFGAGSARQYLGQ